MIVQILLILIVDSFNILLYSQFFSSKCQMFATPYACRHLYIHKHNSSSICLFHRPQGTITKVGAREGMHWMSFSFPSHSQTQHQGD
jgi:hypothetical protein